MAPELSHPQGIALSQRDRGRPVTASEKILLVWIVWTLGTAIVLLMMMYFDRK
jgi:hypothetical protein